MSIANPLVITLGGSGGTAKSLPKVNQDQYGSEYLLREATQEFRVLIRHSRDTVPSGALPIERHNVTFTQTIYGTSPAPDTVRQMQFVVRNNKADVYDDVADLGTALSYWVTDTILHDLMGWVN